MRFLQCIVYVYILYSILDVAVADFHGFFVNITSEFGSAVNTAWKSLVTAIKKPVRIRNIRRKRRTTTTPSSDVINRPTDQPEQYQCENANQNEAGIDIDNGEYVPEAEYKPRIPIIKQPEWKSMVDWTSLQRPSIVQLIQDIRESRSRATALPVPDAVIENAAARSRRVSADDDEDKHFGMNTSNKASSVARPFVKPARRSVISSTTAKTAEALPKTKKTNSLVKVIRLGSLRINFNYNWLLS